MPRNLDPHAQAEYNALLDREARAVVREESVLAGRPRPRREVLHRLEIKCRCRRKGARYQEVHKRALEIVRSQG